MGTLEADTSQTAQTTLGLQASEQQPVGPTNVTLAAIG